MGNTVLSKLAGAFLLLYGIAAIAIAWEAHSAATQAFTSIRSFTAAFQHERDAAAGALQSASGLLGGRGNQGSGASGGSGASQSGGGLRDRLRGLLGGMSQSMPSQSTPSQPSTSGQSGDSLGLLDELEGRINQASSSWSRLGEGPVSTGQLDRLERADNAVLVWVAAHGVVCIVIGLFLLAWSPATAPSPVARGY